jgi:hypothetical protein
VELESTKHTGPPAPLPKPRWYEIKAHPRAFRHAFVAFSLANVPWPLIAGGKTLHYVMVLVVGFVFAVRYGRRMATLKSIYGFGAAWCAASALLAWLYVSPR